MKIAITFPVFVRTEEHRKFLNQTTRSFISVDHDLVVIPVENLIEARYKPYAYEFNHEPDKLIPIQPLKEQSVAHAWNRGIQEGINNGCEYILVINTDIIFKSNAIDRLVKFAEAHQEAVMWAMAEWSDAGSIETAPEDEGFNEHPNFSCYMVKKDFFTHVGTFDENFVPAYCEDGDMHGRLALANKKAYVYGGARFFHARSTTIHNDREAWERNRQTFPKNQQYFLTKWGHPIVGDVDEMRKVYFKHPYNDSSKPLSYWKEV